MPTKKVVVIASGETERRALPHLTRHLLQVGIELCDVRVPPRLGSWTRAERLQRTIKSAWFELSQRGRAPNKFVVLVDADGKAPDDVRRPAQEACSHLRDIPVPCVVAAAQWHLEAWFFGDEQGLRRYLGRNLGSIDSTVPDEIRDPKRHLKHLLDGIYTAETAASIARVLEPSKIVSRSPSFRAFDEALRNGQPA
ncbi:MAG: DUF4276 family protein [Candidatus Binataceae bacterium]